MKPQIVAHSLGLIFMFGCHKADQVIPEKVKPDMMSNTLNMTDGDDLEASYSDISVATMNDIIDYSFLHISPYEGDISAVAYYYGKIEVQAKYRQRNLRVMVSAPYEYVYKRDNGRVYKIGPAGGDGDAIVSFIGTQGDIVSAYTHGQINSIDATGPDRWLETYGNIIYNASEKRTIVRSMSGNVKVMAGFHAEVIEIGSELEEGFTVESATNETGAHTGEMQYTLKVWTSGWTGLYPNFYRTASIYGAFYGTPVN